MMTRYQVLQDGKPCSEYKIKGWEIDTFDTFEQAADFSVRWCYPCIIENYQEWPHPTLIDTPVNMSYCEFNVMMEIREVQS